MFVMTRQRKWHLIAFTAGAVAFSMVSSAVATILMLSKSAYLPRMKGIETYVCNAAWAIEGDCLPATAPGLIPAVNCAESGLFTELFGQNIHIPITEKLSWCNQTFVAQLIERATPLYEAHNEYVYASMLAFDGFNSAVGFYLRLTVAVTLAFSVVAAIASMPLIDPIDQFCLSPKPKNFAVKKDGDNRSDPDDLMCPISLGLLECPTKVSFDYQGRSFSHTYSDGHIRPWLVAGNASSPSIGNVNLRSPAVTRLKVEFDSEKEAEIKRFVDSYRPEEPSISTVVAPDLRRRNPQGTAADVIRVEV